MWPLAVRGGGERGRIMGEILSTVARFLDEVMMDLTGGLRWIGPTFRGFGPVASAG